MRLKISGRNTITNKDWNFSYSRLHYTVRYLALKYCGMLDYLGTKDNKSKLIDSMIFFMSDYDYDENYKFISSNLSIFLRSIQLSGKYFPNIFFHSDYEGTYTKNRNCDPFGKTYDQQNLLVGNSIQLLKELELLVNYPMFKKSKNVRIIEALKYTKIFYEIVKEELKNGTGTIDFY